MRYLAILSFAAILFTGCGTPEPTKAEGKQQQEGAAQEQERAAKEEREQATRRLENELHTKAMEQARFIRERAYCAPSPESLGNLYEVLKAGDSERAAAIADLTGAKVLEPKTRILVLKIRPFYQGIGANLVRVNRSGGACFVVNRALVD